MSQPWAWSMPRGTCTYPCGCNHGRCPVHNPEPPARRAAPQDSNPPNTEEDKKP